MIVWLLFFWTTFALTGDLWNIISDLNSAILFGYKNTQKITVDSITTEKIVIKSPLISDDFGTKIKKYTVIYGPYSLDEILSNTALVDQSKEKSFTFSWTETWITMELNLTDTINPNTVYYLSVIPKDDSDMPWDVSNEIWFKLADKTSWEWKYQTVDSTHASAWADMSLAGISHTINWNKVNLTWIAVGWSDKIDIFLRDPSASVFNKLTTVNMTTEKYEFPISRNWEFIVKFVPNNVWKEKVYTFTVTSLKAAVTPTTKKIITKVPKVWPTENIFVIVLLTFAIYLWYKKYYKKA